MTTDTPLAPTDAEIADLWHDSRPNRFEVISFARAVLARWGQPAHSGEPDCAGSGQPITQEDIVESREIIHTCLASALLSGSDREARRAFEDRHKLYSLLGDANCHLYGEIAAPQPGEREPCADSLRHQNKLLAESLGACILASGIVRKDIDGFTGPQLLHFAEDLRSMLAAAPQPVEREPLPDSWIRSMCAQPWVFDTVKQWVRITEAAHGIKGGQHGADT